jgi:hypothetical protein
MIWNKFRNINISIFIADFANLKDDEYCDVEVNEIPDDIEIHNFISRLFSTVIFEPMAKKAEIGFKFCRNEKSLP